MKKDMGQKMKSKKEKAKVYEKDGFWTFDGANQGYNTKENAEKASKKLSHQNRLNICKECEHYNKFWKFCNLCGCFMPLKTKLRWAECPDEPPRWT